MKSFFAQREAQQQTHLILAQQKPPQPTQPPTGNVCNGQTFDPNAYSCDNGRLCGKNERACGSNPHACYKESMYKCVNGQLQPK